MKPQSWPEKTYLLLSYVIYDAKREGRPERNRGFPPNRFYNHGRRLIPVFPDHVSKPVIRMMRNGAEVAFAHTTHDDYMCLRTSAGDDGPLKAQAVTVSMQRNKDDMIVVTVQRRGDKTHHYAVKHTEPLPDCYSGDKVVRMSRTSRDNFVIGTMIIDGNTEAGQEYLFNIKTHEIARRNVIRPISLKGIKGLEIR